METLQGTYDSRYDADIALEAERLVPREAVLARIASRYGINPEYLNELAAGDTYVQFDAAISQNRGLFEHSTAAYLDAVPENADQVYAYLRNECATALFETVGARGHYERLRYPIDRDSGDAFVTAEATFGSMYIMDLAYKTFKWRAPLAFTEFANNELLAELTRRGILDDHVAIEMSPFPTEAETTQAAALGYDPETRKSFIRSYGTDTIDDSRVIETLSYSDITPSDVNALRQQFNLPLLASETTGAVLGQMMIMPKVWFESQDGLAGLARRLDAIKSARYASPVRYGQIVAEPVPDGAYRTVAVLSEERKRLAMTVIDSFMVDIIALARAARGNAITPSERLRRTNELIAQYRLRLLQNDLHLAEEQYGFEVAAQLDYLSYLQSEGRTDEARDMAAIIHRQLGVIYICGAAVFVNAEGEVVNEKGEVELCPEIKNGESVTCPGCKFIVKVIVQNKDKLYCPRTECKLSMSGSKGAVAAKLPSAPKQKTPERQDPVQPSERLKTSGVLGSLALAA